MFLLRTAAYPANLLGLLDLLGCANDSTALAAAVAKWEAAGSAAKDPSLRSG